MGAKEEIPPGVRFPGAGYGWVHPCPLLTFRSVYIIDPLPTDIH